MHPFIRPGDLVTILPRTGETGGGFRPGECVIFLDEEGRWLIHRVIGRGPGPETFITKGDALPRPDRPVEMPAIAGRVAAVERAGTGRVYRLDRPLARGLGRVIALLSRCEAAVFSPRSAGGRGILARPVKAPRWFLTRIFFP